MRCGSYDWALCLKFLSSSYFTSGEGGARREQVRILCFAFPFWPLFRDLLDKADRRIVVLGSCYAFKRIAADGCLVITGCGEQELRGPAQQNGKCEM